MGTFPDSMGMTSYTLAILFLALKPIVKKLFSIEFGILGSIIEKIFFTNLEREFY
jgi:hypothetical protein